MNEKDMLDAFYQEFVPFERLEPYLNNYVILVCPYDVNLVTAVENY